MANKEAFLNKIAQKLGRSRIYEVQKPKWNRHPWDHLHQNMNQEQLVEQFERELQQLGGEVIRVPSLEELPTAIHTWLSNIEAKNIISWDPDGKIGEIMKEALLNREQYRNCEQTNVTFWNEKGDKQQLTQEAERADVGFTIAEHGLSETGTIVLYNRGNSGRLVSLLPSLSANILLAKDVVPRITQVLAQMDGRVEEYSCVNFITGPSRSADIEMDLSIGVHGPGHLVVFLVEEY